MKTSNLQFSRTLGAAALVAVCAFAFTPIANARDNGPGKSQGKGLAKGHYKGKSQGVAKGHTKSADELSRVAATASRIESSRSDSRVSSSRYRTGTREYFESRPRTSYGITLGDGYAGRGYYYGPANSPYYYQTSGVQYYRSRDLVPSRYWGGSGGQRPGSISFSVQRALAERGYYRGPVDGSIGPGSRNAIARFQGENGMRPTGEIDERLLRALRLN
jgi:hypothetical protein